MRLCVISGAAIQERRAIIGIVLVGEEILGLGIWGDSEVWDSSNV